MTFSTIPAFSGFTKKKNLTKKKWTTFFVDLFTFPLTFT